MTRSASPALTPRIRRTGGGTVLALWGLMACGAPPTSRAQPPWDPVVAGAATGSGSQASPETPLFTPLPTPGDRHAGYVPYSEYIRYDAMDREGRLDGSMAQLDGLARILPGQGVAEIGCGPGPYLRPFADRVGPTGVVYEVDVDPNAIAFVEARLARAPRLYGRRYDNVETVLSSFDDVELPPGSVDWAYLQQVHNYVLLPNGLAPADARARFEQDNNAFTRSVHDALRPGGRMVIVEAPPPINKGADYGPDEVTTFVEGTGLFRLSTRAEHFQGDTYLLVFDRL